MTSTDIDPFDELGLVDRYLAGQATEAEVARVEAWAKDVPERMQLLHSMRAALQEVKRGVPRRETQAVLARMLAQAGRRSGHGKTWERDTRPSRVWGRGAGLEGQALRRWARIAGVTALVVGMIVLMRQAFEPASKTTHVYATTERQQAIINLDAGTRVTLAPHTTVRVQQLGVRTRTVILDDGEAYFEVAHASALPFIVQSGNATVEVLGTKFLVRHPVGDSHVRVAVTDGKVRVTTSVRTNPSMTLVSGQVGDVTDSTVKVSRADDLAPNTEWASGHIMFRHTPLTTVLQTVGQWYGYQFHYADPTLGARRVTMMISTSSSAKALAAIEQVLMVNVTVVGDTVTLVPQPPSSGRSTPRKQTYDVWTATREVGR